MARYLNIPVTTSLHGLGAFPEDDPLSLGMLGMHGTWWANQAVQHADLIIAAGARFDDRVTGLVDAWAPHASIIHIEIDKSCISKNIYADLAFNADVKSVLERLRPLLRPKKVKRWLKKIQGWREECPLEYAEDGELRPQFVLERLRAKSGGNAVVVTDVGQNQMWAAQYLKYTQPRSHITSGGLGTMGFSLPAALGAGMGLRAYGIDKTVISINGDGGFMMNAQELAVAAAHGVPLKVVIMNNNFLGMVRQWQELFHENRFSHTDLTDTNPDFVQLARASRCAALRAERPEQVDDVIEKAWAINDRPVVMEFRVVKEEMVFPMVPAGKSSDEMITSRARARDLRMNDEAITLTPQQLIRKRAAGEPVEPGAPPRVHQHIINVLVENSMGALIRVVNMFSARGFNLDSVTVGVTDDPTISRMCIVTSGNDRVISQILRQLNRLVDTIEVYERYRDRFRRARTVHHQGALPRGQAGRSPADQRDLPWQSGGRYSRHTGPGDRRTHQESGRFRQPDEAARDR